MSKERLMKVLVAPQISEKSSRLAEQSNQYAFRVLPDATKGEVKGAVEMMFNVRVKAVRILNTPSVVKRFARSVGRRPGWKKAYVSLQPGFEIDFMSGQE